MVELVACKTLVGEEAYSSSLELLESASCGRKTGRNRSGWRGSTEKLGYSAHCVWWSDTAERTVNLMLLRDEMKKKIKGQMQLAHSYEVYAIFDYSYVHD
jgi:hypothetical protein